MAIGALTRFAGLGRGTPPARIAVVLVLLLLASSLPSGHGRTIPPPPLGGRAGLAHVADPESSRAASDRGGFSAPRPAPQPAANNSTFVEAGRATFFANYGVPNPSAGNNTCYNFYTYGYATLQACENTTTEPAINVTTDGYTVMAYTAFTNQSPCLGQRPWAMSEVGVVVSTDFGFTWSSPTYVGNPVCTGYPDQNYSSAYEPTLTSLPNGTLVMSYVEWNLTEFPLGNYYSEVPGGILCGYSNGSRIVVTESFNHGASWTTPQAIDGGTFNPSVDTCPHSDYPVVRPKITAFGDTVYLTWTNLSNPVYFLYGSTYSSGVKFSVSTNGGSTWSTSQKLQTWHNKVYRTTTDIATNPSILVDPSGEVYVAYATDYGTTYYCGPSYCSDYISASIEVARSASNGSSWTYVQADAGVFASYPDFYPYSYWEPFTTLAYNPVLGQVYITYEAAAVGNFCLNEGPFGSYCSQQEVSEVFLQNSSDQGANWSTARTASRYNTTQDWASPAYNPSLAVDSAGRIHLTYAYLNDSVCTPQAGPYGGFYCAPSQELYENSTDNGFNWTSPLMVAYDYSFTYGPYREIWDGTASALVTEGPQVLLGWTELRCPNIGATGCSLPSVSTFPGMPLVGANVVASRLFLGPGLTLTFNETGLPGNAVWSVNIDAYQRNGPAGADLSISGVPPSTLIRFSSPWVNLTYGVSYAPGFSVTSPAAFSKNTTVKENFSKLVLVNLLTVPSGYPSYFWAYPYFGNVAIAPAPGPSWVVAGTPQTFAVSYYSSWYAYCFACANLTFLSWTGTGAGSTTANTTSITFTPTAPVNETANFQVNGVCWGSYYSASGYPGCVNYTYDLTFVEHGLPAGTGWGVTTVDSGGAATSVTGTGESVHTLARSGTTAFVPWTVPASGGQYWIPSASVTSPVQAPFTGPIYVTYSLGPLSGQNFSASFDAVGLPSGTAWGLEIGGRQYGVTSANGTFSLAGGSVTSINGTAVYLANGTGYYVSAVEVDPMVANETEYSVAPGGSVQVNGSAIVTLRYAPMYHVEVAGSVGGTVTPDALWARLGQSVSLAATASPGYRFVGWTGTGPGSVSTGMPSPTFTVGGVDTEFATFRPIVPTFNVTVTATGIPVDAAFSISLGSVTYSGMSSIRIGNLAAGVYELFVPTLYANTSQTTRYLAESVTSDLPMSGDSMTISANGTVTVAFQTQYALSIAATSGGRVSWAGGGSPGIYWFNASAQVSLVATPDARHYFEGWNGTGLGSITTTGTTAIVNVVGPIMETAQFHLRPEQPPATYWLAVAETGLPPGLTWSIVFGGIGTSGSSTNLTVTGLNGTYGVTAPPVYTTPGVRWASDTTNLTKSVAANGTLVVRFMEEFEVTVSGARGGRVTPQGTQWVAPGTSIDLVAVADSSSEFLSWNGTGAGSYTGTSATGSVIVNAPIAEQVAFGPQAVSSPGGSAGLGGALWIGAAVGLSLLGLVAGLLAGRRRARSRVG